MIAPPEGADGQPRRCLCGAAPTVVTEDYPAENVGRRSKLVAVHCPGCGTEGPWQRWSYAAGDEKAASVAERLARRLALATWAAALDGRRLHP